MSGTPGSRRSRSRLFRAFRRHALGVTGAAVLGGLVLLALLAPEIMRISPYTMDLGRAFLPPGSGGHVLGTDNFGRDTLSRLVFGARISLLIGIVVVAVAAVIGTVLGLLAGFYGRWVDLVIMRLVEVFYAFPFLILVIAVMAILGPSIFNVMWVLGLVNWPSYARLVRAQVLSLRRTEFIQAARATGGSDARIIFRHILPNSVTPIIVQATLGMPSAILSSAALGFLGFGVQPPTPEWGSMVNEGKDYILIHPEMILWPGVCILVVVLCFNFIGDALQDSMDPRVARQPR